MVNEQDVQSLLRLVAEAAAMHGTEAMRTQRLLRGLALLAAAPIAIAADLALTPARQLEVTSANACGLPEADAPNDCRQPAAMQDIVLQGIAPMIHRLQAVLAAAGSIPDPLVGALVRRQIGGGQYVCSIRRRAGVNRLHLLAVCRPGSGQEFTAREEQLVQLLHEHVESTGKPAPAATVVVRQENSAATAGLPPYLQRIVPELLAGAGEKQIAAKLGFTFNTTHQYIKAIYKRLGVSSRAEFMARCLNQGISGPPPIVPPITVESRPTFYVSRNPQQRVGARA